MGEFKVLYKKETAEKVNIIAMSTKSSCKCPRCVATSTAKHSRYTRKIIDGSLNGVSKEILLIVSKFKCNNGGCSQKIFTERLDFVSSYGRKSNKIIDFITLLALTTSSEKVSTIMNKLGINISNHTVLRVIRNLPINQSINVDDAVNMGIDDFALKKGNRYGTIICNLDTKEIIDVLPSRTKEELNKWLQKYPNIRLVSRDGSQSYAVAY
ncbi:transposase [Lutispora sp.]|nr:transposase [Lutispora sp.]MEA4961235.1 transposase [Lutispora sp.]